MNHKTIYLVRHGETDYNLRRVVQGSGIDASLNQTGRNQAASFYQAYKDVPFDKVYTSTLKRSMESVDSFLTRDMPHEKLSGLNEISWGTREGMEMTTEENEYYLSILKSWREGDTHIPVEGGESPDEVQKRMKPAIDYILKQPNEKTILICMHGRAMRIFMATILNYPLSNMDVFKHLNLGLYLLKYTGSMFQVMKSNDVSHLNNSI